MNHNHEHCKHDNLKYCEHCKVVHCLDCKQEFPEKVTVTVERIVYKERNGWTYPQVTWEGSNQSSDVPLIITIPDKTVWDQDRFERNIVDACMHT